MANAISQRTLLGGGSSRFVVREINIVSDATQETDRIIFDNSAFINDVNKGRVMKIEASGSSCVCQLEWDQTADAPIANFDPAHTQEMCFEDVGGHANPRGAGCTGDILLTTTGLTSGAAITIKITVKQ